MLLTPPPTLTTLIPPTCPLSRFLSASLLPTTAFRTLRGSQSLGGDIPSIPGIMSQTSSSNCFLAEAMVSREGSGETWEKPSLGR